LVLFSRRTPVTSYFPHPFHDGRDASAAADAHGDEGMPAADPATPWSAR
jgi:hypothetical protein